MSTPKREIQLDRVEEMISENVNIFLKRVYRLSDIGPFRKNRKIVSGFEMFEPAVKEYYEYRYFENSLESYIRENLINRIIPQLLEFHGIHCLVQDYGGATYVSFSNEGIENIFPFEFIVETKKARIGYRYTMPTWNNLELKWIMIKHRIDQVEIIDWSDEKAISSKHVPRSVSNKSRILVKSITAKGFFDSYFTTEEYELFVSKIKDAVSEANKAIGFTTIPSLSLSYLSKFKDEEEKTLSQLRFNEFVFEGSGASRPIINKLSEDDYNILDKRFVNCKLYRALIGTEKFATSFLTSEYMFQILKAGGKFDYTSIVCGYIKSIEQLLYKMLLVTLEYKENSNLMIKPTNSGAAVIKDIRSINPNNRKSWLIPFEKRYEEYFDISLGSMIWFINDNTAGWYLSRDGKNTVRRYLLNYSKEDRNEHFHKDNIEDFDEVRRIRNNTITLMYYLIGGYRMTDNLKTDQDLLGVFDDNYDRMYKRMAEIPRGKKFYLKFKNEEEIKAIRLFEQDRPVYDSEGSLRTSNIRFIRVNDFDDDYDMLINNISEENQLVIDCHHMPEQIWISLGGGKRIPIEW